MIIFYLILLHAKKYENYSSCHINFIRNRIVDSLIEQ
jgi:hypothetical protein